MAGVFLKRGNLERDTHAGRMSHEFESRDRGDAYTSQGKPKIAGKLPGARGVDCHRTSLHPQEEPALLTLQFLTLAFRTVRQHISVVGATLCVVLCSGSPSKWYITPCPPDSFQSMAPFSSSFHLVPLCLPIQASCGAGWGWQGRSLYWCGA